MTYIPTGKGSDFAKFTTDFWYFQQKYLNGDPNQSYLEDSYWETLLNDAAVIGNKYKDTPFYSYCQRLLFALMDEAEERMKSQKGKEEVA